MATRTAQRESFLADVLTTAIEGGIGYWADITDYRWYSPGLDGGTADPSPAGGGNVVATIFLDEHPETGEENVVIPVTLDTAATGIARVLDGTVKVSEWITTSIRQSNRDNDCDGVFDAICADVVVQAALFGEVVFA